MKHHIKSSLTAIALLALLGSWSLQAQADTKVRTSSFEYDASGLLIKEVVEPDRPNDCLQTSYTYDAYGNKSVAISAACAGASGDAISSATIARAASSWFGADGRFPVSSTNNLGQSETKQYDARFGAITSLAGPNGLFTYWQYDGFGRKIRETRSDNTYTSWAYKLCTDAGANCPDPIVGATSMWVAIEQSRAANSDLNAPEKRAYYDTLNRVVRSQTQGFDGAGPGTAPTLVQDTEYDALGRVARKSNLYKLVGGTATWTSYSYDVLGRVITEASPDPDANGGVTVTSMSYNGLVTTVTNSKNQTKTTTKNAQGQVALVTDAQGNTVSYSYDALGQLILTNAAGSPTTMEYNQRGQKVKMVDPAMGVWEYSYNVFGELVWQRDSLSRTVTMAYDTLGRMTQRAEPDLFSQWSYDKKFDGSTCGTGVGKLCEATSDNGYKRVHSYDDKGRPSSTSTVLDNPSVPALVSVTYDNNTGRQASKTWPTLYRADYLYTASGYLKKVTGNGFNKTVTYEVLAMDAQGHITQYKQGDQVTTVKAYNEATGRLGSIQATKDGAAIGAVMHQTYQYDALSNLTARIDVNTNVSETFQYDTLNRLSNYQAIGGAVSSSSANSDVQVIYDARGNIAYKSDVGEYHYDAARPNRLTNVTLSTPAGAQARTGTRVLSYAFDDAPRDGAIPITPSGSTTAFGNGNLWYTVSQDTQHNRHSVRWETYTSFNMPQQVLYGNLQNINNPTATTSDRTLTFVYGPEHQRIKQNVQLSANAPASMQSGVGTTWYLNGEDGQGLTYEKEVKANGITENKHYVSAGGVVFALFVQRTGNLGATPATATRYFHHDHLGSIAAISDESGAVVERLAFDPWGKRRFENGTPDEQDEIVGQNTDRGYTMHEHLDEMGVIHMNGRIYDPLIGRFMSADPFIQSPDNLQSYNRYAYVLNNPLAYTDPSGYWSFKKLFRAAVVVAVAIYAPQFISHVIASSAGTAAVATYGATLGAGSAYAAGYAAAAAAGSTVIISGAVTGFAVGAISSGNVNGALQGALSGGLFAGVGASFEAGTAASYAGHAVSGCISSAAGGGNCGSGAASALLGKFATNATADWGVGIAQGSAAVIAGGVGSTIAGGKFANGAQTAAFGYLFNQVISAGRGLTALTPAATGNQNALVVQLDRFFSGVGDQLSYIFKSDSVVLARNMVQETDQSRDAGQHAHHIVAAGDPRADPARNVLANAGMDINSAFNGVFLDPSQHARIHTNVYYNSVNTVLGGASGYADVAARLTGMRVLIQAGKFPF